jgi:hypothetical protein
MFSLKYGIILFMIQITTAVNTCCCELLIFHWEIKNVFISNIFTCVYWIRCGVHKDLIASQITVYLPADFQNMLNISFELCMCPVPVYCLKWKINFVK